MTILAITFTIVLALYFLALGWATQRDFDRLTAGNDGAKRGREVVRACWKLNGGLFL